MFRPTPLILRAVVLAALVVGLLAVSTVPASAEPPPQLEGPVTDRAGALDGGAGDVEAAIAGTLEENGVQAWVLFVDSTDGQPAPEYATETARINSLGADDALVLVALGDRTDSIWVAEGLDAITDAEIDAIIADELEPRLRDGDFTGAAIAAVEGLGAANDTAAAPEPTSPSVPEPAPGEELPSEGQTGGDGPGLLLPLLFIGLIVGGVFLVIRAVQGRGEAEERDRKTGALARDANSLLISTDERIRDAAQEVDFVEAQYGPSEVEPLRQAVAQARDELKRSFEIRQRLDDAEPEDAAAREQMLREIVERLTRAHAVLDAQTERIRQLRDLERDAPETLAALPGRIDAVEGRLPAGEAALKALDRYAPSASQTVRGNVVEARKGLAGAREAVANGTASLQAGDTAKAASATRLALEGVTGATGLLDAIDRLAASIAAAEQQLPGALREAETDFADARATHDGDRTRAREPDRRPPFRGRTCAGRGAGCRSRLARGSVRGPQHGHRSPATRRRGPRRGPRGGRRAPAPRGRGNGIDPDRGIRSGSGRGLRRNAEAGRRAGCPDAPRGGRTQPRRRPSPPGHRSCSRRPGGRTGRAPRQRGVSARRRRLQRLGPGRARMGPATWRWRRRGRRDPGRDPRRDPVGRRHRRRRLGRFPMGWLRRQPWQRVPRLGQVASAPAGRGRWWGWRRTRPGRAMVKRGRSARPG